MTNACTTCSGGVVVYNFKVVFVSLRDVSYHYNHACINLYCNLQNCMAATDRHVNHVQTLEWLTVVIVYCYLVPVTASHSIGASVIDM